MKKIIIFIIKLYQQYLSPLKSASCRFYPSCSQYTVEAVDTFGVIKGLGLACWRILRCNPFHPGGYDPVKKMDNGSKKEEQVC